MESRKPAKRPAPRSSRARNAGDAGKLGSVLNPQDFDVMYRQFFTQCYEGSQDTNRVPSYIDVQGMFGIHEEIRSIRDNIKKMFNCVMKCDTENFKIVGELLFIGVAKFKTSLQNYIYSQIEQMNRHISRGQREKKIPSPQPGSSRKKRL